MKEITLKLGNMRKPADFVVYPKAENDTHLILQSDKRIAKVEIATGKGILSSGKGGHPGFIALMLPGTMPIELSKEQLAEALGAQPKSGDKIGSAGNIGIYVA